MARADGFALGHGRGQGRTGRRTVLAAVLALAVAGCEFEVRTGEEAEERMEE